MKAKRDKPVKAQEPRTQFAALPFRAGPEPEILLVSSRETKRWVIPKGWPMKGRKPHAAAAQEALEEAGLLGKIEKKALGSYHYVKNMRNGAAILCRVDVFPLQVDRQRKSWPERDQRMTRWFTREQAAEAVREPELADIIRAFTTVEPTRKTARMAMRPAPTTAALESAVTSTPPAPAPEAAAKLKANARKATIKELFQATAIAAAEAEPDAGKKLVGKKVAGKKLTSKKLTSKKAGSGKASAKKIADKDIATKKTAGKKTVGKKTMRKKAAEKKAAAGKPASRKGATKKAARKFSATGKSSVTGKPSTSGKAAGKVDKKAKSTAAPVKQSGKARKEARLAASFL